jgi:hypothetical protein
VPDRQAAAEALLRGGVQALGQCLGGGLVDALRRQRDRAAAISGTGCAWRTG